MCYYHILLLLHIQQFNLIHIPWRTERAVIQQLLYYIYPLSRTSGYNPCDLRLYVPACIHTTVHVCVRWPAYLYTFAHV